MLRRRAWIRRVAIVRRHVYTGPTAMVRALVRKRAGHECEWPVCGRVGTDYHHRLNRKQGGRHGERREQINQASWILLCCRTHHTLVTSPSGEGRVAARMSGWLLYEEENALEVAVHTRHGWVLLDDEGGWTALSEPCTSCNNGEIALEMDPSGLCRFVRCPQCNPTEEMTT